MKVAFDLSCYVDYLGGPLQGVGRLLRRERTITKPLVQLALGIKDDALIKKTIEEMHERIVAQTIELEQLENVHRSHDSSTRSPALLGDGP